MIANGAHDRMFEQMLERKLVNEVATYRKRGKSVCKVVRFTHDRSHKTTIFAIMPQVPGARRLTASEIRRNANERLHRVK